MLPLGLVLALAATGGLALLVVRDAGKNADSPAESTTPGPASAPGTTDPAPDVLRPYLTTSSLKEDLRDALAGDPAGLDGECWRVSKLLASRARSTLVNLAPEEASPKVRALLTLAAGVHVQEDDLLLRFMEDREPVVRAAAALAAGYEEGGGSSAMLLQEVRVPLGRYDGRLEAFLKREKDETVRAAIKAVLSLSR